jgi:hypothetical protein
MLIEAIEKLPNKDEYMFAFSSPVVKRVIAKPYFSPSDGGEQAQNRTAMVHAWIPAFAGMTAPQMAPPLTLDSVTPRHRLQRRLFLVCLLPKTGPARN